MEKEYAFVACMDEDMEKADKIFKELEKNNIKYRFSKEFLNGDTVAYKKTVYPAIEECSFFIAVISMESSKNINMHFEVSIAKESEKKIIPVLLSQFDLKKESPCWDYLIGNTEIKKLETNF
jgi:hypothetical protein